MYKNIIITIGLMLISSCSPAEIDQIQKSSSSTWLIKNALIYDGTGADPYEADIRMKDGVIAQIGIFDAEQNEKIWDAKGMVLSPGFIDPHSHHDSKLMQQPAAPSILAQGITTIVSGMDGFSSKFGDDFISVADNMAHFEKNPAAINLAYFGPHNEYRATVMGDDFKRPATAQEIDRMGELLSSDLNAGALGLSTGIEYEPTVYSTIEEVISLAKIAASVGGKYSSHIRSEDVAVTQAFEEVITIAREADIAANISHIKLAMFKLYGQAPEFINMLDAARAEGLDITADIYPYDGWQSTLAILIPSRDNYDRAAAEFALTSIISPANIIFTDYEGRPHYTGKTLQQIAVLENMTPVDTLMNLLQTAEKEKLKQSIIGRNMSEGDIENFMKWPYTAITTDGGIDDRHPRGQGTFARVLGHYVREKGILPLSEAIRKMTSLAARNLGFNNRGEIKQGYVADIVIFDPDTITDHATFNEPLQYSTGIKAVWVNGELVWENDKETGARPGKIIRRQ